MILAPVLRGVWIAFGISASLAAQTGSGGAIPASGTGGGGNAGTVLPTSSSSFPLILSAGGSGTGIASVELTGLQHTWAGDLQIVLRAPSGSAYNLVSRLGITDPNAACCGYSGDFNGSYTIVPSPGSAWPAVTGSAIIPSGTYGQDFGVWVDGSAGVFNTDLSSIPCESGIWALEIYDGASGDSGSLVSWTLTLGCAGMPPPANDSCATPQVVVGYGMTAFDSTHATTGIEGQSEPGCSPPFRDLWFEFQPTETANVTVSTCGSSFDTVLLAWPGSVCPMDGTSIACNDDLCGLQSEVTFNAYVGETYMIQVGALTRQPGGLGTLNIFRTLDLGYVYHCGAPGPACPYPQDPWRACTMDSVVEDFESILAGSDFRTGPLAIARDVHNQTVASIQIINMPMPTPNGGACSSEPPCFEPGRQDLRGMVLDGSDVDADIYFDHNKTKHASCWTNSHSMQQPEIPETYVEILLMGPPVLAFGAQFAQAQSCEGVQMYFYGPAPSQGGEGALLGMSFMESRTQFESILEWAGLVAGPGQSIARVLIRSTGNDPDSTGMAGGVYVGEGFGLDNIEIHRATTCGMGDPPIPPPPPGLCVNCRSLLDSVLEEEDFEGFASDVSFAVPGGIPIGQTMTIEALSSTISGLNLIDVPPFAITENNGDNQASCYVNADAPTTIRIDLGGVREGFGADVILGPALEGVKLEAYLGGQIVGTCHADGSDPEQFVGWNGLMDEARFVPILSAPGIPGEEFGLDNLVVIGVPLGTSYCGPAVLNSTGQSATIVALGSSFVAANDVTLRSQALPPNQFTIFLTSLTQGFTPMPGGSQGNLCLGGQIGRYNAPGQVLNSGSLGHASLQLNLLATPTPMGLVSILPGETWNFQGWMRDFNPTPTSNFTHGLSITFQ